MKIDYINKDISHIDRVPQVVQEKTMFYNLIKGISDYIDESTEQIYNIFNYIVKISNINETNANLQYLQRLLVKSGVKLGYLPTDITESTLQVIYKMALQASALLRNSDSTKANLKELLAQIFAISENDIEIYDTGEMGYSAVIKGINQFIENDYLGYYLRPTITGVNSIIQFNTQGYLASMKVVNNKETSNSADYTADEKNGALYWMPVSNGKEQIVLPDNIESIDSYLSFTGFWAKEYK